MARAPILAAGGIVVRDGPVRLIALVKLRKRGHWVLPKGKLHARESALAAARREAVEETGHEVSVHEFLGTMSYEVGRRPKIVQFWRAWQATSRPARPPMRDVTGGPMAAARGGGRGLITHRRSRAGVPRQCRSRCTQVRRAGYAPDAVHPC